MDDEILMLEITKPALLVKQYQDEQGRWRVIPNRTIIIDKPSWDEWLSKNNSHPITREPMDKAKSEGIYQITRYRIRPYANKNDSQELIEATIAIRQKLDEVNPANIQVTQVVSGISATLRERFFGGKALHDRAASHDERSLLGNSI